jgi:hypothetical protein
VLALADRHFTNGENNQHVARCFHALLATLANEFFLTIIFIYTLTFILYLFSLASNDSRGDIYHIGTANPMRNRPCRMPISCIVVCAGYIYLLASILIFNNFSKMYSN